MAEAKEALEELSDDWLVRRAAQDRAHSEATYQAMLRDAEEAKRANEEAQREVARWRAEAERTKQDAERTKQAAERTKQAAELAAHDAMVNIVRGALEARFGELPGEAIEWLQSADGSELASINVRLLSAESLEAALGNCR